MNLNLEFADPVIWNNENDYAVNDVVFHDDEAYTAIDYVPVGTLLTDSSKWKRSGKYIRTTDIADGAVTLDKLDTSIGDFIEIGVRSFDTVSDMQAATLKADDVCHTNGFHASGDGGAAFYKVTSTGTANDMDVLACGDVFANLIVTENCVTPEMFGAYGDGEHDDSSYFQQAFNYGVSDINLNSEKTYLFGNNVTINESGKTINGANATINTGSKSGFVISPTVHDIEFTNMNMVCNLNDSGETNGCIIVSSTSDTEEFESYNITVKNSSFYGGVYALSFTNVKNVVVENCTFEGCAYRPDLSAGGYAILLQSCVNVSINGCSSKLSFYGRHDIYVSVKQSKTINRGCKNVEIVNCKFDHSNITVHEGGAMFSPNTPCITCRAVIGLTIENVYAYKATGVLQLNNSDGDIYNATVRKIYNDSPILNASVAEAKQTIGTVYVESGYYGEGTGTQPFKLEADFSHVKTVNPSGATYLDMMLSGTYLHVHDMNVNYQVQIAHVIDIDIDNIYITKHASFLYTYASEPLTGSIKNITSQDNGNYVAIYASNHNISPTFIRDENLTKVIISNTGGISTSNPHINIACEVVDTNMLRITFTDLSGVPSHIMYQPLTYHKTYLPTYGASGDAANQMRLIQFDESNARTTNFACRCAFL